jgi:isocitrate dehydrogenase
MHQVEAAAVVHNAWLRTIEEGMHTADIYEMGISKRRLGTQEFANAVIAHLGEKPRELHEAHYYVPRGMNVTHKKTLKDVKKLVGVDIFLEWDKGSANELGDALSRVKTEKLKLKVITNRGIKVYPEGLPETFCTDHWRCRFWSGTWTEVSKSNILDLLNKVEAAGFDHIKTENLYTFNDELGFSEVHG